MKKKLKEKLKSCQGKEDRYTSFLTYRIFSFSNGVNKSARNSLILFLLSHLQNKCLLIISLINNQLKNKIGNLKILYQEN